MIRQARQALSEETDVITIIKQNRYFSEALKHLLPEEIRRDIKTRSEFVFIGSENAKKDDEK